VTRAVLFIAALLVIAALAWALRRKSQYIAALQAQLEGAARELQSLQEACARLAPAGVVQRLVADRADSGAERKVVTALFSDLVGYTAMSERLEPTVLARIMNGYFQRMSDAIHEHRGHVSTFVGDGVLAYFGALQHNPWQCDDAVRAALAMRAALRDYNKELADEGLQALTRVHQVDILVTEAVREHLDPRFVLTLMPPEQVKGIDEPVVTYAVRE
jgi:class 3 adenylate cyclase